MDTRKQTVIACLRKWIAQRPGLEFGNYGEVSAYRSEMRSITKDRHHAEALIRAIELHDSITADHIIEGSQQAFSGRLRITEPTLGRFVLDYCTGQYWPTEYRRAVCAVASSVLWAWMRDQCMPEPDSFGVACLDDNGTGRGYVNATSKRWPTRDEATTYATTVAQDRRAMVVEFHKGKRAGDYLRDMARSEFGRTIAQRWFN